MDSYYIHQDKWQTIQTDCKGLFRELKAKTERVFSKFEEYKDESNDYLKDVCEELIKNRFEDYEIVTK